MKPCWIMRTMNRPIEWLSEEGSSQRARNLHLLILLVLFSILAFIYYVDQTPLIKRWPFNNTLFTGVHDLYRTLFLIPIIYAALIFRLPGSLLASLAFFGIILPRAFYFSPYPNPVLRSIISVALSTIIGVLITVWINRLGKERKARTELMAAYEEIQDYDRRLKENQAMLIQAEKLASMGQLSASIAHEINNPLSGVLVYTKLLSKKIAKGDLDKEILLNYLSKMDFELNRSTHLIRSLLAFAKQSEPIMEKVDVNKILVRALDITIPPGSRNDLKVKKEFYALPEITADSDQLQQVFINLIVNAVQAMPEGGNITLLTFVEDNQVKICIKDTGCGIPPENMGKIFTPFFSTKKDVRGVGLGLPVSYGIIQRHLGKIEIESKVGEGSSFTVCLPIRPEDKGKKREEEFGWANKRV